MTTVTTVFDHAVLSSKSLCKQFLRELGVARDWDRCLLAEMRQMLKAYPDAKMFEAAKTIVERDGEKYDKADFECEADDIDEQIVDEGDDEDEGNAKMDKEIFESMAAEAAAAAKKKFDELQNSTVEIKSPATSTKQEIPGNLKPAPKRTPTNPAEALAAAIAAMMEGSQAVIDPAQVAAIANTVFDSKADSLSKTMEGALRNIVDEAIKGVKPREIVIKNTDKKPIKIDGLQHFNFEKLLKACSARMPDGHRLNVWLYGPPGTGKTTAARNVSKALGLAFYTTGSLLTKYDITGFVAAQGNLVRSPFREAWEHGGVYLFDEIDGSAPAALVAFNAALANGVMAFPDGMIDRHPDCVMIAAANTSGMGATAEFNGRMKMDMATIDRYVMIDWPIDEAIETALSSNPRWAKMVQQVRSKVSEKGIKGVCITPRATIYGCALIDAGMSFDDAKQYVLKKAMSAEQWAMVTA